MYQINVPKPKWRPKTPSAWIKNSKEVDDQNYSYIFEKDIGQSLRKMTDKTGTTGTPYAYNSAKDKKELETNLVFDDSILSALQDRVRSFVIDHWDVFREAGVSVPVDGYEL
eukprot:458929-Ditylum_brightwellii.AAC.1